MTGPVRIRHLRTKGWRKPLGAVSVARPALWGNPYLVGSEAFVTTSLADGRFDDGGLIHLSAANTVELFRGLLDGRLALDPRDHPEDSAYVRRWRRALEALRGHDLMCWCALDAPCHGDVLLDYANRKQRWA